MRDHLQTDGKRSRLRSTASTGRPFFRLPCDRIAAFDKEVEAIEIGSNSRLQEGLAEIQRQKTQLIAAAESWRNDRIMNIENEFEGAIKAAIDQYQEDVRHLRSRLVDEVKRNRRRYLETNGLSSPQIQRKKARMPSTMQAASTRSSSAALSSQHKPVAVKIKLSDDEIRSDLKRMAKTFSAASSPTMPSRDLIRVELDACYVGSIKFQVGDQVICGRLDDTRTGCIEEFSSTEINVLESATSNRYSLPFSFVRTGMAFIEHRPASDDPMRVNDDEDQNDANRDVASAEIMKDAPSPMMLSWGSESKMSLVNRPRSQEQTDGYPRFKPASG